MSMGEAEWRERAQSAEARLATQKEASDAAITRVQEFKANFGIKERQDGAIDIDFDKFVKRLGPEGWLALRRIGDEHHGVSGAPGEKPRVKVAAA